MQVSTRSLYELVATFFAEATNLAANVGEIILGTFNQLAQGIGDAVAMAIFYGENLGESMLAVLKNVGASIVSALITMVLQYAAAMLIAKPLMMSLYATEMGQIAAATYGHAFKAYMASPLGSPLLGGPAMAAIYATGAVAQMIGQSKIAGAIGAGLSLAAFAEGGIVKRPTLALVGEAGPEAVIPLSRHGGTGETTVIFEMDGRAFAKATIPHIPGVVRQKVGRMF
jgi:hypothetical protein